MYFGADAVYFAGKSFGLRAFAGNFTEEEMIEAGATRLGTSSGIKIIEEMKATFPVFHQTIVKQNPLKAEYYLPMVVNGMLEKGTASVEVLKCPSRWYGVTYAADKPRVVAALMTLPGGVQTMSMDIPGLVQTSLNLGIAQLGEELKLTFAVRSSVNQEKRELLKLVEDVVWSVEVLEYHGYIEVENAKNIKDGEFKIHLSTGVEYSEEDIEKLMAKNGLDYDITLSDQTADPDGDKVLFAQTKDAEITFNANDGTEGTGLGADKNLGAGEGLTFQIGANGVEDQRLTVNVSDMSSTALGVGGLDISTQDGANSAINKIDDAIKTVSSQRAKLGAVQNRLEHTVNSLSTAEENLQSAESQIRDTDMASEMIKYTKSNILQQASQSMLAQANQQPQGVLQLLG